MDTDENEEITEDRSSLVFHWLAISLFTLIGGVVFSWVEDGAPNLATGMALYLWICEVVGVAIGISIIPLFVAAWTHFRRPWLALVVWLPCFALCIAGALSNRQRSLNGSVAPAPVAGGEAKPQPQPSNRSPGNVNWNASASTFEQAHPELHYGGNYALMQFYIDQIGASSLSNQDVIQRAYAEARNDPHWSTAPAQ